MQIVLPRPHAGQLAVYESTARFRVMACGRRWGKTNLEQTLALQTALGTGRSVGWFAPNYKYLGEPYREMAARLSQVTVSRHQERFLELQGGVRIDFWTLEDQDAGRGFKYGRVVIDEAGMCPKLGHIFEDAIRPTLTDYEGDCVVAGTPKGRNFFHEMFTRQSSGAKGWESFQCPTSGNPFLPSGEYNQESLMAEGLPERTYRQEYLAEFLDDAGGVFTGVSAAVDKGRKGPEPPGPDAKTVGGLDLGQSIDYTVLSLFDLSGRQVYLDRFNKLAWDTTADRVAAAVLKYRATVLVDATGVGQPVFESLRSRGCSVVPFKFTSVSKPALVERAVAALSRGDIRLLDNKWQEDEIKAYEYEVTKGGHVRMGAPPGLHDDTVMALCLAVKALERPSFAVL